MAPPRVFLALLFIAPLYVSAFVGVLPASLASLQRGASSSARMMSVPFELPKVPQEEAVVAFDDAVVNQELPTLVYFHAKWCGPCIMQGPVFDQIAEEFDGKAKVVKLDCDNHKFLMNKYRVRGLPYTVLFHDGKVIARHEGHLGYDGQVEFLRKVPGFE
ncbi:unnamed protein product [Ectocarpus sp. CCAP 1310/34]|nr:unnamed protein product [Ectocarpus sp. CCAP 1310/34]